MTVAALSENMTAAEEAMWICVYRTDPWGDERADMRSAQISQILYNTNVKKEDRKKLTDFLPFYRKPAKPKDENVNQSIRNIFGKLANRKK